MFEVKTLFELPLKWMEPTAEDQKKLALDQAVQSFSTQIDSSLDSQKKIKSFIYPLYTTSPLYVAEKREKTHDLVENYLTARKAYSDAVSNWAEEKFSQSSLNDQVELARESLRAIDPELVGEKRYEKEDFRVVQLGKQLLYALSRLFSSESKINRLAGRLEVLEEKYSLEQDQKYAVLLFQEVMEGFLPDPIPGTVSDISTFFETQYADLSPTELMEIEEEFSRFQAARALYFERLSTLSHPMEEIFLMNPLPQETEAASAIETTEVEEERSLDIEELPDQTIYTGSLVQEQVRKTVGKVLSSQTGNQEMAQFVAEHLIPTGARTFVLYKNEKRGEVHFDAPKEGIRTDTKNRKYLVDQTLVFTYDDEGKIEFESEKYRIGVVSKDLERHLDKAPYLLRGAARAALGEYIDKGLKLTMSLVGMSLTNSGVRLYIKPVNGEKEIPMAGGVAPSGLIGSLIQAFSGSDEESFDKVKQSLSCLVWQ